MKQALSLFLLMLCITANAVAQSGAITGTVLDEKKEPMIGAIVQVLEGTIDFTVDSVTTELMQQQVITVHPGIMHTIRAVSNSLLLITTTKMQF